MKVSNALSIVTSRTREEIGYKIVLAEIVVGVAKFDFDTVMSEYRKICSCNVCSHEHKCIFTRNLFFN